EVFAHLAAENAYTRDALAHLSPLRTRLFDEIVGRVQETDTTAPVRRGDFEYFTRTVEGLQYGVHCRRPVGVPDLPDPFASPGAPDGEVVVIDENALAGDLDYFAVGDLVLDPAQSVAAYTVDTNGGERYELRFRRVPSADGDDGHDLDDVVPDVYYG